ncbi:hypothetical protein GGR55DRAFT_662853 [Xylaria sp. FL0064]|nr:hypothetical protein GGR55DRAFT_662853 [Xylaria sp. FL0064]
MVKVLLQHDAKIMLPDDNEGNNEPDEDYTVVEKAIILMIDDENEGKMMLATLLRAGVDVNRQSKDDGKTPLHLAALLGLTEVMEIMYAIAVTRPDLTIRDEEGKTAVEVCVEEGHEIDWERIMASRE